MNFPISFGIYLTPNLSNFVKLSVVTYNAIQRVPIDSYSSRFFYICPSFILTKFFFE